MTELLPVLLAIALIVVFGGMAALIWRVISALQTSNSENVSLTQVLAQMTVGQVVKAAPLQLPPVAAPISPPPVKVLPVVPVTTPKPVGAFSDAPPWFQWLVHEIGFHETGNNQGIDRYIALAHTGANGDPWCAIAANAALEAPTFQDGSQKLSVPGTRSPSSQSFRTDPGFVPLTGPALGCIVVFWRISKASGQGHVGFYRGEDSTRVWTLGGNENDMVQIEALPKDSPTFGLIGYFWPKGVALPTGGPVLMPAGSPVSVQVAPSSSAAATATAAAPGGLQTAITATVFGGQKSAYGPAIDDNAPGVALPFHFPSPRPQVRVTGKSSGQSAVCEIVDVGPWNINDPYWTTGARPQAETGTDLMNPPRHTNKAGIDLTAAAAKAIGIDGKGLCDWSFVETAAAAAPPTVV
jgi:hypothetical protein